MDKQVSGMHPAQASPSVEAFASARALLESSLLHIDGRPVGTIASLDPRVPAENYRDCFVRDFVSSALVFLLEGRPEIVRNFLDLILRLRGQQDELHGQQRAPGVLPASFKIVETLDGSHEVSADFGDRAIGRVAPVDSMMWWVLLLRAYTRATGDATFSRTPECQRGLRQILNLCLQSRFEVFPTLLVPDGSFMIDRRMGVDGHPLEIQALFHATLRAARELLIDEEASRWLIELASRREDVLRDYVREYYWLDMDALNRIHRYDTELFGHGIENALNIYPDSIPPWVPDWLPDDAGYLVGNLGPGHMDFRFFAQGNLLAAMFGLSSAGQSRALLRLFDLRWEDLIGTLPLKIAFPAVEGEAWRLITGCDPKNTPWSYHNGGNWPTLLWPFVAACLQHDRADLAQRAVRLIEARVARDDWPEYYDGRRGRLIGRKANRRQIWSASAFILARHLLDDPACLQRLGFGEEPRT
ncbi:MAG: glycoside hydrolase 100 family protein [Pseudomonadota bacterium]